MTIVSHQLYTILISFFTVIEDLNKKIDKKRKKGFALVNFHFLQFLESDFYFLKFLHVWFQAGLSQDC